jgi:hypothetical protein
MTSAPTDTKTLEARLRAVEDRLEILNLIASHPPSVDTGADYFVRAVYVEDGTLELDYGKGGSGNAKIAAVVKTPAHQAAIAAGMAHFAGLPRIDLDGDTAVVTSYLQILMPNPLGESVALSNHGESKGFRVHAVGVSRWELVRTKDGWKIKKRSYRPVDSPGAREIMRQALVSYEGRA